MAHVSLRFLFIHALAVVLALAPFIATACGSTNTFLAPVDARAVRNQQRAVEFLLLDLPPDAGQARQWAETIYCGAGGTLQRAGLPREDAGIACPNP